MATISIKAPGTRWFMSTVPAMPRIVLQAEVLGTPPQAPIDFVWGFALEYGDFIAVPGSLRRNVRTKVHPPMARLTGNPVTVPLATLMCGRLTVTVEATVAGQKITATRNDLLVGGTNPGLAELRTVVPSSLLRRLIHQESGGKQFSDNALGQWSETAINPNWSSDNLRGVGLGQLTNPPPADDDIWNWRSNAQQLRQRFDDKRRPGATLHTRVAASQRFTDEVKALNAWRAAEGLLPLSVVLPALDADQLDREGLRAYNGFGAKVAGQYLSYVHEYEPAMTVLTSVKRKGLDGQALRSPPLLDVDATGRAKWVQISGAERLQRYGNVRHGEPNYVARVLAQPE